MDENQTMDHDRIMKINIDPYQDRTQIYKALLTKKYNGNRGEFPARLNLENRHRVKFFVGYLEKSDKR